MFLKKEAVSYLWTGLLVVCFPNIPQRREGKRSRRSHEKFLHLHPEVKKREI